MLGDDVKGQCLIGEMTTSYQKNNLLQALLCHHTLTYDDPTKCTIS